MHRQPTSHPQRQPANLYTRQAPCQPSVQLPTTSTSRPVGLRSSQSAVQPASPESSQPMTRPLTDSPSQPDAQRPQSHAPTCFPESLGDPHCPLFTSSSLMCIVSPFLPLHHHLDHSLLCSFFSSSSSSCVKRPGLSE